MFYNFYKFVRSFKDSIISTSLLPVKMLMKHFMLCIGFSVMNILKSVRRI